MADVEAFGLTPAGHHLSSVVLHALAAVLMAGAAARFTGAGVGALVFALIWAVHPVRVESVAWVSERKDVLASVALGGLLLAYRRYVARPSPARFGLVALVLALGLMTKPILIAAPILLLVLDWWPLGRLRRDSSAGRATKAPLLEKVPLIVLAAGAAALTVFAQREGGTVVTVDMLPLPARAGNALDALVRYLGMAVWPERLAAFYPHPEGGISGGRLFAEGGLLVSISLLVFRQAQRRPWLIAGWSWYLVALLPVIGLIQVGAQARADRYMTLPLLGLLVMGLGTAAPWVACHPRRRSAVAITGAIVIAALTVATARQITWWRDDRTLFERARTLYGNSAAVNALLGLDAIERRDFGTAERELRSAIAYSSSAAHLGRRLSWVLERLGRPDEAADEMARALATEDPDPVAEADLGLLYDSLGRTEEALACYQRADAGGVLPPALRRRLAELRVDKRKLFRSW